MREPEVYVLSRLVPLDALVLEISLCIDSSPSGKVTKSSFLVLLIGRYQLELKDDYITRTNRLIEDERKNKGDSGGKLYFSVLTWALSFLVGPVLYSKKDIAYTLLLLQKLHVFCFFNFIK